jgi:hypothetical protein
LDVTPDSDLGLVARYTNTHLRYTGEDFSTFPALPAAQPSASNTDQYYARATGHLISLEGALNQTLGVAFTRNQTATLQPQLPESLNTGERARRSPPAPVSRRLTPSCSRNSASTGSRPSTRATTTTIASEAKSPTASHRRG